jgi:hypothetical protein
LCQRAGTAAPELLPPLHDAVLSWMGPHGFVLTGIEILNGVTNPQSWWCRPLNRSDPKKLIKNLMSNHVGILNMQH